MNYLSKLMMALFFAVSLFFIPLGSQAQSVYFSTYSFRQRPNRSRIRSYGTGGIC